MIKRTRYKRFSPKLGIRSRSGKKAYSGLVVGSGVDSWSGSFSGNRGKSKSMTGYYYTKSYAYF